MNDVPPHDAPLSPFQAALILSLFPSGASIHTARAFRPEYEPGPMRVEVALPGRAIQAVVLRLSRRHGVTLEAQLFELISRLDLPVPKVLAGPITDPDAPEIGPLSVLSLLPGQSLQHWSETSSEGLDLAMRLVIEAVSRLHQLTDQVRQAPLATRLPHQTLLDELQAIQSRGGPWLREPVVQDAIHSLQPVLAAIRTPLVFSNGDYQPGNFLSDGRVLTGFLDFESACVEDPHVGIAKYRIYDLHPLNKAGFITRYLQTHQFSERDFAPRLALRCLWTLQREIPVNGGTADDHRYRTHVLHLLHESLRLLV